MITSAQKLLMARAGVKDLPLTGSFSFDESLNQSIQTNVDASDLSGKTFTMEAFFYLTGYSRSYSGQYAFAIMGSASSSGTGWELTVRGDASSFSSIVLARGGGQVLVSYSTPLSLETWYHVSITKNQATNTYTMYLDGTQVSTNTNTSTWSKGTTFFLGRIPANGFEYYFDGNISQARIIDGTEIAPPSGGPSEPITSVSGTTLLTAQGNGLVDNGPNSYSVTSNNGASNSTFGPFPEPVNQWDISGASYDSVSLSLSAQEGNVRSLFFSSNGSSFYITGLDGDDVTQYNMSTAWDITSATAVSTFAYTGQTASPQINGIWFEDDGLTFYLQDSRGDNINPNVDKYTCSTAWDISTASYASVRVALTGIRSISLAAGGSQDLFFKPDGTSFYVPDNDTDKVFQYDLSTAWDITTATLHGDFSVTSQDTVPVGVNFTPDGKKMFVTGISTDRVYQYTLATAWDVTTASYDSVFFSVQSQATSPLGTRFKDDGTKMYVADRDSDALYQYSTA